MAGVGTYLHGVPKNEMKDESSECCFIWLKTMYGAA